MSGKKKSPTKKTAQEIREMISCIEQAKELIEDMSETAYAKVVREADRWIAMANKLIGEPK